jgi:hypothetical protein
MSSLHRRPELHGRHNECAALDRLLQDVRAQSSRVLVLRGQAGIGKTALLEYLVANASGCRIARAAGVESEMELPFAGIHQLCAPMLSHLQHLPGPQRAALETAFGLNAGMAADRFIVGLAVLSLLSRVAEAQPLVCLVDDAHWLGRVSAQILAFVSRRLLAEPMALVFAVREHADESELGNLPVMVIGGLNDNDARAVLDSVVPGRLDERVRDRIVAETRGNPLALLELPQGLTAAALAGEPAQRFHSSQLRATTCNEFQQAIERNPGARLITKSSTLQRSLADIFSAWMLSRSTGAVPAVCFRRARPDLADANESATPVTTHISAG